MTTFSYANDSRRPILVNGARFAREQNRKPEPDVTLAQSAIAGIVIAIFAIGILALAVAAS
jgi:hypothetical protein